MSDYQRSYNREDPRLSRHGSSAPPKENSLGKAPPLDPRTRTTSASSWDNSTTGHNNQYNQPPMQTAYQHLQPNNMYNNTNQYPNQNYYGGYENYANYNPYQYGQAAGQQPYMSGGMQPGPPGSEDYPQGAWAPVSAGAYATAGSTEYNQNNSTSADKSYKTEGVVEEMNKQKANLIKERDTYEERVTGLRSKLELLVKQKNELSSKPAKETNHIIKENNKLQLEIQSKMKDATNVIEILSGLIGDNKKSEDDDGSKPNNKADDAKLEKVNYKHYDPEIHWCRMCDVFPQSAKELLVHLHAKKHQETAQEEIPWHKLPPEPKFAVYEGAPVRRLPIKGLQFFVASTAWYCRLCDTWIGDLHCASQHLMSITHSQNYSNFVEQNPHWEIEWLKDREKALERIKRSKTDSDSDDKKKKHRKDKYSPSSILNRDKKKKKRKRRRKHSSDDSSSSSSSSSSSDDDDDKEDKSKSIRVAMRNKIKMLDGDGKWEILGKLVEERKRQESKQSPVKESPKEDKLMSQWMTISEPPDKDKHLLDSLKEKLKQKQDAEKARMAAEYEAQKMQRDREEFERKQKEKEKLELEREDEKRRDKMSLKMKEHMKFKGRDNYRRQNRSPSHSPDHRHRRSRSPGEERKPSRVNRRSFDVSPHMRYNKENNKEKSDDNKREQRVEKKGPPPPSYKKLPFIGRMPLFKNQKGKKPDDDKKEQREIQKEDYDIPRKTRFQPGNLARSFIPEPEVVCFPKLSTYPPIPPPPPVFIAAEPPEPPKISLPKPPPPPKIEKVVEEPPPPVEEPKVEDPKEAEQPAAISAQDEYSMLYEDSSNTMMYPYGNVDFNMMYPPPESFNFMQVAQNDSDIPRSHKMPLQPPPLPPDDPNDDLAMLGISSDDMAVQQMY